MSDLVATRQGFGEALADIIRLDERVVALTADLGESLRMWLKLIWRR
jgi:transketolase C-terminal domain/subunit